MKKITLVLLALLIVASCIGLAACNNNAQKVLDQYLLEQDQQLVEKDFVLPAQISGVDVTWTSDNEAIQIEKRADDYLAKVVPGNEVTSVTLTVSAGKASKSFTVRVTKLDVYYLASKYIFTKDNATVTDDFTLDKTFVYDGKTVNITWSVDESFADYLEISEDGYTALVYPTSILPEVRIKATFSYGGETTTKSFKVVVGIERSPLENINYWYSNTDVSIEIKGYVVAVADPYSDKYGNVSLYVVDESFLGGYYLFQIDMADPSQASLVVPGAYVVATGTTNTVYNGIYETNKNGLLTVDTSKEPIDVSEHVYAFDQDLLGGVPAAIHRQSSLVSLTNWAVKSVAESAPEADKTATLFTLEKGGVEVTIAVSKYMKGEYTAAAGDEKWEAICALRETVKVGDIVSVEGILSSYNNNHQICLVDASGVTTGGTADPEGTVYPGQTAAKAIADVEKALTDNNVTTRFTKPAEFTLPTESNGVEIKYELCRASDSVVLDGAKFTVTPGKQEVTTVQITYTLKDGETVVYSTSQFFNIESLIPTLDTMIEELEVPPTELEEDYKLDENAEWVVKSGTGIEIVDGVAKVTRSDVDQKVVLTATVTLNGETKSRDYYITIPADPFLAYYVINLNVDSLGLELNKYADGTSNVAGVEFAFTELGNYGNGTQWRIDDDEEKSTSSLKNTTAFHQGIKEIMITMNADKQVFDNTDVFSLKFGTSPDALGNEIKLSTVAGQYVYNIKLDGTATYFSMTKILEKYSFYIDSIKIAFASAPTFTDTDKVNIEKSELKFDGSAYTEDATATLPIAGTTHTDVTITWAADNSAVVIDGANFTLTMPETSARIVLTATLKCGTVTDTKEFIIFAVVDVLEAAKLMEDGDKLEGNFELTGTVKSIDTAYNDEFGNVTLTITVGDTDIKCYRMKGGAAAKAKVGDKLVVTGSLENYKGDIQFSSGAIGEFGEMTADEKVAAAKEALTLEKSYSANFTLPSEGLYGTALSWTVKEENPALVIDGYNVTVTPGSTAVQVVIVATIALDGATNLDKEITVTVEELKIYIPVAVETPTLGTFKLAMNHTKLGKMLYFIGDMDGFYYATSEDTADAVDITVAAGSVADTYTLSFVDVNGVTQYLYMEKNGTHTNVKYDTTPADWKWNDELKTYTFTLEGEDIFLGTDASSSHDTISQRFMNQAEKSIVAKMYTLQVATDADLAQLDKDALELETSYTENFTLPATGAYGSTITWAVTEGTAITIEGTTAKVTRGDADATVKLTATIKLNEETLTKEFTITVPKLPAPGDPITVTMVAADKGWENQAKVENPVQLDTVASLSYTGGANTGKYYTTGAGIRFYQNENPEITISVVSGYTIKSVTITYTISNTGSLTLAGSNVGSSVDEKVYSYTGDVNAASITFGVGNTGSKTNGQVRISAITVVYVAA